MIPPACTDSVPFVLLRAARLIALRGWCQGLSCVGDPEDPRAVSAAGALVWATTGLAHPRDARAQAALMALRGQLDPWRSAPFDDWELAEAWNDASSRTREEVVSRLVAAARGATVRLPAPARGEPLAAPDPVG